MQDDDPYVRKTAAICVAKLHDINAEMVEDRGFLDQLKVAFKACLVEVEAVVFRGCFRTRIRWLLQMPLLPWLRFKS